MDSRKYSRKFRVVQPIEREGREQTYWHRIGTAFENPEKKSITVLMDSLPPSGKIVLFEDDGERDGAGDEA